MNFNVKSSVNDSLIADTFVVIYRFSWLAMTVFINGIWMDINIFISHSVMLCYCRLFSAGVRIVVRLTEVEAMSS